MKIVTLVLVMAVVVTVTESRPFFGIFPFRSIVCDIMCQPPYLDSFCAFCDRSAPGRNTNTAQSSASASSNGNANVQAQSSASVQRGNGTPVRRTTTTTTTTGASSPPGGAAPATPTTTPAAETTTGGRK